MRHGVVVESRSCSELSLEEVIRLMLGGTAETSEIALDENTSGDQK
jgi:ABC-type sugar transport system ATPase subunit